MQRIRSLATFAAIHVSVHDIFNIERGLASRGTCRPARAAALTEGRAPCTV